MTTDISIRLKLTSANPLLHAFFSEIAPRSRASFIENMCTAFVAMGHAQKTMPDEYVRVMEVVRKLLAADRKNADLEAGNLPPKAPADVAPTVALHVSPVEATEQALTRSVAPAVAAADSTQGNSRVAESVPAAQAGPDLSKLMKARTPQTQAN